MADFTRVGIKEFYIGASTDDKPASAPPGSQSYEHDTGALFIMAPDMSTWTAYAPKKFIADGTVAAPGLAFASDPDTGIYRVGANTIGLAAGGIQAMTIAASVIGLKYGFTETLTPSATAAGQTVNAAPSATTLTAANAQAFTGTAGHIVLPAITPAANGSGITLTGLNFTQGAIANVADSEAITVKHIVMTFAAGAALETGVLTQTAIDITLANQAANGANNQATGIKITGGTLAGGASAYQRGIDITMAAATDAAINIGAGTLTMPNNTAIKMRRADGDLAAQTILYITTGNRVNLVSPLSYLDLNREYATDITMWGGAAGTGRTLIINASDAASGAGNVSSSPTIMQRALYRDGANALQAWDATVLHSMTTGGATPASSVVHAINSVTVLTLTNTNGTPSATFPGNCLLTSAADINLTVKGTGGSNTSKLIVDRVAESNYALHIMSTNGTEQWSLGLWTGSPDAVLRDVVNNLTMFSATPNGALTLKPKSANGVRYANSDEGGTGSMNIKTVRQVVNLSGASTSTTINIPAGAMLLGASFCVNTAVVTSAATNTWDADFTGGSTTNLVAAGAAGAQNTKANKLIVPEIASAQTNIEFDAPGAETFSSGAIEVVAYYIDQTSLANA